MAERLPYANMPHGQISAIQHGGCAAFSARSGFASAYQHFSTLQPAAVACQQFSLSTEFD
jgi:hypothetical protein